MLPESKGIEFGVHFLLLELLELLTEILGVPAVVLFGVIRQFLQLLLFEPATLGEQLLFKFLEKRSARWNNRGCLNLGAVIHVKRDLVLLFLRTLTGTTWPGEGCGSGELPRDWSGDFLPVLEGDAAIGRGMARCVLELLGGGRGGVKGRGL